MMCIETEWEYRTLNQYLDQQEMERRIDELAYEHGVSEDIIKEYLKILKRDPEGIYENAEEWLELKKAEYDE